MSDWKLIRTLEADDFNANEVGRAAFSPDNAVLATASNFSVRLWRVADGKFLCTLLTDMRIIKGLIWSPNCSLLISFEKAIQLWSWLRR